MRLTYWNLVLVRTVLCLNRALPSQARVRAVWFQWTKPEQPMVDRRESTKV